MADSNVRMPDDTGNAGKKIRTFTRTVGTETVHEHYNILQDETNDTQARILTTAPGASDGGLVVRNVHAGIGSILITNTPATNTFIVSGNVWTGIGSVINAGGNVDINNPATIGSYTTQTVSVASASTIGSYTGQGVTHLLGPVTHDNISVGSVSTQLIAANASRQYLLITNESATDSLYVFLSGTATVANGMNLLKNGGFWESDKIIPISAINAIRDTDLVGAGSVRITEL